MTVPELHVLADVHDTLLPGYRAVLDAMAGDDRIALHLRDRRATGRAIWCAAVRAMDRGARVIINDRADVAIAAGARGIHLPSDGLPTPDVRALASDDGLLVGRSTHDPAEADAELALGADYVFMGPIWPTKSHPDHPGIGLGTFTVLTSAPVVAIGGVTLTNTPECLQAGAHGVAVISAVWSTDDPAAAVTAFRVLLDS